MPQPRLRGKPAAASGKTGPVARSNPPRRLAAVAVVTALVAVGCGAGGSVPGADEHSAPSAPVTTPIPPSDPGTGAPGALLVATPISADRTLPSSSAWHISYRMTGVLGQPVVATALVVVPAGTPPTTGWPVVVWGHPTRGMADHCAPALSGPAGIPHAAELLQAGFALVAPDYEGLGTRGPHPYLVGTSEGRSMLHAALAAPQVAGAGIRPGAPVVLWGFSQGGHAAAFAAELAGEEAPELDLRGVAVAAPVSDVVAFAERAEGRDDQLGVLLIILAGLRAAHPEVEPSRVLGPVLTRLLAEVERRCIGELVTEATGARDELLVGRVADDPVIVERLEAQRAGDRPVGVPALVVQGDRDDTVDPADTAALVERWCRAGGVVEHVVRPGGDHGTPAIDVVLPWLVDRVTGVEPPSTCGQAPRAVPPG